MRLKRCLACLMGCIMAMSAMGFASAAGSQASAITQQKVVAGYRLMLAIGPTQKTSDMGMKGSAMTVGGKPATCRVPGNAMTSGMNMHAALCNRLVAVHVFNAKTNKVVIRAHVAITMRDTKKHTTIAVPIMMMVGVGGLRDFQYGNNITVGPGAYSIAVTVNGAHTTFTATLK
jgi:hypothetical protein